MHPHPPRTCLRRQDGGRQRGVVPLFGRAGVAAGGENGAQEGLARRPDEQREAEGDEFVQMGEQRQVVRRALSLDPPTILSC